ncbi:MAG: hypothetical protein IJ494_00250 [Bacteroides sp.]|nr:hypothetical protein [Bacteroides sp.]
MNRIFNYRLIAVVFSTLLWAACSEDKGNYVYGDKEIITIEGIPEQIAVLANAENIVITPTITSNLRGEITDNSADFEFSCERKEDDKWIEMCSSPSTKDINMLADLSAQTHTCRYSVIDKETGVRTSKLFYINATTITSEGWILLCNEESTDKVRVDMLSHISMDRILPAYNVLKFSEEVPELKGPRTLTFVSSNRAWGNKIIMTTETDAYLIPCEGDHYGFGAITKLTGAQELKMSLFLTTPTDHVVRCTSVPSAGAMMCHDAVIAISKEGNAFVWDHTAAGAGFEYPVNTSSRGADVEYKVAPFVGTSRNRTWNLQNYGIALLYDIDNKRFIGWDGEGDSNGSKKQKCYPLINPENKLFDVTNTGMDLVCMLNTLSNTLCIMQDGNSRHIYSFNVLTKDFLQEGCYLDIQAEHFNEATLFEASCQYPVIYYAYQNRVYSYNYATGDNKVAAELPTGEEVTMIKFNRYDESYYGVWWLTNKMSAEEQTEFTNRENQLIVASYNSSATEDNGGTLRFYETTSPGVDLTLRPDWEYTGFAKIVDVVYKEVRR